MKFGGGCLKYPKDIINVYNILTKEQEPNVLVVSALYGVTNLLLKGIENALLSENSISNTISELLKTHKYYIDELLTNSQLKDEVTLNLVDKLKKVERLLYGVSYTEEVSDSVRAIILSYGERLSVYLLSSVLNSYDLRTVALEADQLGILTDDSFDNATADLANISKNLPNRIEAFLTQGYTPIVTGYFGVTKRGKVSTFGRNGTDYSASVIAYCLSADSIDIWKDVDGFMTADPNIIQDSKCIDRLSYYEAAELSYFGAKILHPRTVEPLITKKIKLNIKNTKKPEEKGTLVELGGYEQKNIIKGVTFNTDIALIKLQGSGVGYKPGIIGEVGQQLNQVGINIYSVITAQTCINLLIDIEDKDRSYNELKKLNGKIIDNITVVTDVALVAVVGKGLLQTKGLAAKVFSVVAEQNVNIEMISSGASDVAYYFIIKNSDLKKSIKAIHYTFFKE